MDFFRYYTVYSSTSFPHYEELLILDNYQVKWVGNLLQYYGCSSLGKHPSNVHNVNMEYVQNVNIEYK